MLERRGLLVLLNLFLPFRFYFMKMPNACNLSIGWSIKAQDAQRPNRECHLCKWQMALIDLVVVPIDCFNFKTHRKTRCGF